MLLLIELFYTRHEALGYRQSSPSHPHQNCLLYSAQSLLSINNPHGATLMIAGLILPNPSLHDCGHAREKRLTSWTLLWTFICYILAGVLSTTTSTAPSKRLNINKMLDSWHTVMTTKFSSKQRLFSMFEENANVKLQSFRMLSWNFLCYILVGEPSTTTLTCRQYQ